MKRLLIIFGCISIGIILISIAGCLNDKKVDIKAINAKAANDNSGPAYLLNKAKYELTANKPFTAKATVETLLKEYPDSINVTATKELLRTIDSTILKVKAAEIKVKAAEKAKLERDAENRKKALANLSKDYDEFQQVAFYKSKITANSYYPKDLYCYIVKPNSGDPYLRLVIRYWADDWLFIKSYHLIVDSQDYYITASDNEVVQHVTSGGDITETLDRLVDTYEYGTLKTVSVGKVVKMRFNGEHYYDDIAIGYNQKLAIKQVLDAYKAIGGIEP